MIKVNKNMFRTNSQNFNLIRWLTKRESHISRDDAVLEIEWRLTLGEWHLTPWTFGTL